VVARVAIVAALACVACGGTNAAPPPAGDAGIASDAAAAPDAAPDAPAGGAFGDKCTSGVQCASGVCLPIGRCSKPCEGRSDCPPAPEWQCAPTGGGRTYCACTPSGPDVCDGRDNDCDTIVDGPNTTCPNTGNVCQSGQCVCPPQNQCSGACVDTTSDRQNCGACGTTCTAVCASSKCRNVVEACATDYLTCARTDDGTIHCWGDNMFGQLGDGTTVAKLRPTANAAGPADALFCGADMACAKRGDGSVRCWGYPTIGNGTIGAAVAPTEVAALAGARILAVGNGHACFVRMDGKLACWGANPNMELGVTSSDSCQAGPSSFDCSFSPLVVPGVIDVAGIAIGSTHTCVRHTNGDVECWGAAAGGALGDGSTTSRGPTGVAVARGTRQVVAGSGATCVLMNDGTVRCWGSDGFGLLGAGGYSGNCGAHCSDFSVVIGGLTGVVELAMTGAVVCARMNDATMKCWGEDTRGQIGVDPTVSCPFGACVPTPTVVPRVAGVTAMAVGGRSTFAVLADGTMLGWGSDLYGALGDGMMMDRTMPASVRW